MSDRRRRVAHYQLRHLEWLRWRATKAIKALDRAGQMSASVARFLTQAVEFADEHGGIRIGAASLGDVLLRTKQRVFQLEAQACAERWLQMTRHGGGKHRVNRFLFKIGEWRDDPKNPHAQHDFAERLHAFEAAADEAELALYLDHLARNLRCCLQFAPRELKHPPPEIEWVRV